MLQFPLIKLSKINIKTLYAYKQIILLLEFKLFMIKRLNDFEKIPKNQHLNSSRIQNNLLNFGIGMIFCLLIKKLDHLPYASMLICIFWSKPIYLFLHIHNKRVYIRIYTARLYIKYIHLQCM